jgi:hypothetical protein
MPAKAGIYSFFPKFDSRLSLRLIRPKPCGGCARMTNEKGIFPSKKVRSGEGEGAALTAWSFGRIRSLSLT